MDKLSGAYLSGANLSGANLSAKKQTEKERGYEIEIEGENNE